MRVPVVFDGIIYKLQRYGGASLLFNEIIHRMPSHLYSFVRYDSTDLVRDNIYNGHNRIFEKYRRFVSPVDGEIYHSTCYRLPKKHNGIVVTTVHDFTYEKYRSGLPKLIHSWHKNKAIKESDYIICVSENTKADLLYYCKGMQDKRIKVVHNGVSEQFRTLPDIEVHNQVLFVGRRGGYKNFRNVVKALKELPCLTLSISGGGELTKDEQELLETSIPGRYRHLGFLSVEALNVEYNKSLCLMYPSLYEGFGIPVLEAMRAGCPVIATNCSSIPEVTGRAAILTDAGAVDELIYGVESLLIDENRRALVDEGYVQSRKFSWQKTFDETFAVYEELLDRTLK